GAHDRIASRALDARAGREQGLDPRLMHANVLTPPPQLENRRLVVAPVPGRQHFEQLLSRPRAPDPAVEGPAAGEQQDGADRQDAPAPGPYLRPARARALAASSSGLRGGALVSSVSSSFFEAAATSSIAAAKASMLTFDGLANPLSFLTNCAEAARISSSVTA